VDLFLRLVAIAATAVFLAATALMLLTFRRARRVTTASLLAPVLVSGAILLLYCALLRAMPSAGWVIASLVAGVVLGVIWARTHTLFRTSDGGIRSRASLWYLGAWAGILTLNQLVVLAADRASTVLLGLLVFSTGVAAGNGLSLLRRLRVLRAAATLALGLAASGALAGADDVLLLLPREFEVQPRLTHALTPAARVTEPLVLRFRGEEVSGRHVVLYSYSGEVAAGHWTNFSRCEFAFEGTFRRGHLDVAVKLHTTQWGEGSRNLVCEGVIAESWSDGRAEGTASADGRLDVLVRMLRERGWGYSHGSTGADPSHQATCDRKTTYSRPLSAEARAGGVAWVIQLPVGALQSTVKATPRPTPVPVPAPAGATRGGDDRTRGNLPTGAGTTERASAAEAVPAGEGAEGASTPPPGEEPPDGGDRPVSPLASAGAAAGAAALSLLGAIWMLVSSGVRPGELLSAPPPLEAPEAPFVHRDGDVQPETGEVWSEPDGGWVSPNLYELDRGARLAEVEGAQGVGRAESRRESAETDRELRASEARQREAAAAQADAARVFELEASFQPEKVEAYQPAWSDHVTTGLEWAEYGADTGVSLLGEVTGKPGQAIGRIYTVTKETVKGASEGVAAYARGQGGVVAEEGSAWVVAERAGIGLAKGGAKVGLDAAAGRVMDGVAKLAGRRLPELPDLGEASLVSVVREVASGGAESATRKAVGIAAGKTAASQNLQKPASWAVEAATGEKL
jgi:hypothetical protein